MCLPVILLILAASPAYSQNAVIDSLSRQLAIHQEDTFGIKLCIRLATEFSRSDMQRSRDYVYRGMALAKKLNTTYGLSGCYSQLTTSYQNASLPDSVTKYLSLLRSLSESSNDVFDKINYYMTAGLYHKNQSQFDQAIPFMLKALEFMDETNRGADYAGQLLNIGNTYMNMGDLQRAAEYHLRALEKFEKLNHLRGQSFCYQSLGNSYLKLKQYRRSLDYYNRSRELKEQLKDARGLVSTWNALGNVYLETGDYTASLESYSKALSQARALKLRIDEARSLFDIGALYAKMKRPAEAKATLDEALPIAIQVGDSLVVARIRSEQSKLNRGTANNAKVFTHLKGRVEAANRAGDLNSEAYGYLDLSDHYFKDKDYLKAYEYLQLHHRLRDSVAGREVLMKLHDLEQQYENDKREQEIALLKKDQQLTQEMLARQRASQRIIVVVLASVVVLSVVGLLYLRLRNVSKRKEELNLVRNSIARDLHDDIGSALSSISIMSQVALNDHDNVKRHLQKISESSTKMMEGMSDIVWSINPENESLEKMIIRMKEFAGEMLEPANISHSIVIKGDTAQLTLDPKMRKSIFLVFKESINNTAKYSGATEVSIELTALKNKLTLRVKDNGNGFEAGATPSGNGLSNMSSRAADVNGFFRFNTAPGCGTEVLMEMPLT